MRGCEEAKDKGCGGDCGEGGVGIHGLRFRNYYCLVAYFISY